MNRTAEKVLSVIAVVLTALGTIGAFFGVAILKLITNDPTFKSDFEMELLSDPAYSKEDVELIFSIFDLFSGFIWLIIIALIISMVLNIIGIVNVWNNKNAKLAGIMFIIAGVLCLVISVPSILLYVAGILCFTKKPPLQEEPFVESSYSDTSDTMRPL
ncbi:magnesium-transporting ATPase (P-type) [Sporosarcina luteola]|nr:magnesium-transporting ATPase (P-type) [Sporosarcina luteola]